MLIGKEQPLFLTKFAEIKPQFVVIIILLFSLAMNIGHIFQFQINFGTESSSGGKDQYLYPLVNDNYDLTSLSFNHYALAYFLINYVFFLVLNTGIEAALVRKLFQELQEKKRKLAAMASNSQNLLLVKINEIDQKERRAIFMVISNSCINLVLRFSDIFVYGCEH
jgi:hypothetical protein